MASLLPPAISASSDSSDTTVVRGVPAKVTSGDAVGVKPIVIEASRVLENDITGRAGGGRMKYLTGQVFRSQSHRRAGPTGVGSL